MTSIRFDRARFDWLDGLRWLRGGRYRGCRLRRKNTRILTTLIASSSAMAYLSMCFSAAAQQDREALVAAILDGTREHREKQAALNAVGQLSLEDRRWAYCRLLANADTNYAHGPAIELVKMRDAGFASTVIDNAVNWSDEKLDMVLGTPPFITRDDAFAEVPLVILKVFLERGRRLPDPEKGQWATAVDFAAAAASLNPGEQTIETLRRAVRQYPHTFGPWLGLVRLRGVSETERRLARDVFGDSQSPLLARAAACVVLGHGNEESRRWLLDQASAWVDRHKDWSEVDFIIGARTGELDRAVGQEFVRVSEELGLLVVASTMDDPELLERFESWVMVRNEWISEIACVTLIKRRPERFLELDLKELARRWEGREGRFRSLLAAMVVLHPTSRERVVRFIPPQDLDAQVQILREVGNTCLGRGGLVALLN